MKSSTFLQPEGRGGEGRGGEGMGGEGRGVEGRGGEGRGERIPSVSVFPGSYVLPKHEKS